MTQPGNAKETPTRNRNVWHNRPLSAQKLMKRTIVTLIPILFFLLETRAFAAGEGATGTESHGLDPAVLIGIALMLVVAKLMGEVFERLGQPAVLGELFAGIVLGNL